MDMDMDMDLLAFHGSPRQ